MVVRKLGFVRGENCYIVENNKFVRPAKVVSKQGKFYTIQLLGSCGAIRLSESRLFKTKEEAEDGVKALRRDKIESEDLIMIPDVFEGRRVRSNPYIFDNKTEM